MLTIQTSPGLTSVKWLKRTEVCLVKRLESTFCQNCRRVKAKSLLNEELLKAVFLHQEEHMQNHISNQFCFVLFVRTV